MPSGHTDCKDVDSRFLTDLNLVKLIPSHNVVSCNIRYLGLLLRLVFRSSIRGTKFGAFDPLQRMSSLVVIEETVCVKGLLCI